MAEIVPTNPGGEFLLYQTQDGRTRIQCRFEGETLWLTQQQIAELFQTTKQNVSQHIHSVYNDGELQSEATVKRFLTVRQEGQRQVQRNLDYFNLDDHFARY